MARRNRETAESTFASSFDEFTLIRDESSFSEYLATEKLTKRPVRIVEISSEVMRRKSEQEIEDFLQTTGRAASMTFSSSLLRVERPATGSLVLVVEPPLNSMRDYFGLNENRQFDTASTFVIQIALVIYAFHQMGLVHGGIREENISIDAAGTPSVWGAGLDRFCSLTSDMSVMPSDATAPELLMGAESSNLSDLFSLGAIAYFAFIGQSWTNGFSNVTDALLTDTPIKLTECDAPAKVVNVIEQLLMRDFTRRTASAEKVIQDLNRARVELGLKVVKTGVEALDVNELSVDHDEASWALGAVTATAGLDFSAVATGATPTSEGIRDAEERGLSVFAVSTGPKPKVVIIRNDAPAVGEIEERPVPDLVWEERHVPVVEEWSPATKVDEWTIFAGDLAPVAVCTNGHRVSHGSQFCNFCGVSLTESKAVEERADSNCPNGHPIPHGNRFCGVCGRSAGEDVLPAPTAAPAASGLSGTALGRASTAASTCLSGHPNDSGVELCITCGARMVDSATRATAHVTPIDTFASATSPSETADVPAVSFAELDTSRCVLGHPNTSAAAFCRECGSPVEHKDTSKDKIGGLDDNLLYCPDGHPNREFARFCRWCAQPLVDLGKPALPTPAVAVPRRAINPGDGYRHLPSAGDVAVIFTQESVARPSTDDAVLRAMTQPKRTSSESSVTETLNLDDEPGGATT